jgi:hypothetical protein
LSFKLLNTLVFFATGAVEYHWPDIAAGNLCVQRLLIILGLLIVAAGVLWPWLSKLPFGRLPGDVVVDRPGFKLFAPFTTMIIVSLVVSLIVWLLRR